MDSASLRHKNKKLRAGKPIVAAIVRAGFLLSMFFFAIPPLLAQDWRLYFAFELLILP